MWQKIKKVEVNKGWHGMTEAQGSKIASEVIDGDYQRLRGGGAKP